MRLLVMGLCLLVAVPVAAQAPTLPVQLERAKDAEAKALKALQQTDAYQLYQSVVLVRRGIEQQIAAAAKGEGTKEWSSGPLHGPLPSTVAKED